MQFLKQRLLETGAFIDNEAFSNYCQLIVSNYSTTQEKGKTQRHHILPRAWFNIHNKPVDNSKNNLVNLKVVDHIKAHLYLIKAASSEDMRNASVAAVRYMCDIFKLEELNCHASEIEEAYAKVSALKAKQLSARRAAGLNERRRAVVCIETGQVFSTIKEAEETMHVFIKAVLNGTKSHAGGYHFKYEGEEPPQFKPKIIRFTDEELIVLREQYPVSGTKIPALLVRHSPEGIRCKAAELGLRKKQTRLIKCVETGECFNKVSDTGYPATSMYRSLRDPHYKCGGYHWEYTI